jgi:hypothetical protein
VVARTRGAPPELDLLASLERVADNTSHGVTAGRRRSVRAPRIVCKRLRIVREAGARS